MPKAVKELAQYINRTASVFIGGLVIDVKIIDARMSYGKPQYNVTPIAGRGEKWVETVTLHEHVCEKTGCENFSEKPYAYCRACINKDNQ